MKVIITGGFGFLGQCLAKELLTRGSLRSGSSFQAITLLVLSDLCETELHWDLSSLAASLNIPLQIHLGDISDSRYCQSLVGTPTSSCAGLSVFHLAAVMSGAPADLAIRVNLDGTRNLLEATRTWQQCHSDQQIPTFLFSSAGATVGAGQTSDWVSANDTLSDATRAAPHTTYGMTKACCELLLADYSRRAFLDGRGVRLPTVIVRAGKPNAATTSSFSSIVRDTLAGRDVVLPIDPHLSHAVTGYRAAIQGILAVHDAPQETVTHLLGSDRTVFLPTTIVSLNQLEQAIPTVLTPDSLPHLGNILYQIDKSLTDIVRSFPTKVNSNRALQLGAPSPPTIPDIIRDYCHDFTNYLAQGVTLATTTTLTDTFTDHRHERGVKRVVALLTGGGSGIGRAVAVRLSRGGWGGPTGRGVDEDGTIYKVSLVLAGRRLDPLKETKYMCDKAAREVGREVDVLVCPTDVTHVDQVHNLFRTIHVTFQRLDLLFNNAGINMPPTSVEQIDMVDFQRIIDTNLVAAWSVAKGAMQLMSAQHPQGGRIINNGSISAVTPRPGSAPYTASKHGILGLTKSIALDGRAMNITCSQVDFGNVQSDLTTNMSRGMPQANGSMMSEPVISVEDAANTVFAMVALPMEANILNMTVMASNMPFVGRG